MTDGNELRIERVIDAPPAIVWQAWTGHFEEWFCPRPWRVEVTEQQLVPGGRSAMVMKGPNGEENAIESVILEATPQRRIVSTDALTSDWRTQGPFMVRIDEFEDLGDGRTRYSAIARHWTTEARDQHQAMGFEAGWNAATDQLVEVVARLKAG
jgi:uncharacterized protein YndB with AHSA1/START domain